MRGGTPAGRRSCRLVPVARWHGMNNRIMSRIAAGSLLLLSGGLATATTTAYAAEGPTAAPAAPAAPAPAASGVTQRLSHLAATGDATAGRAASWVEDTVPEEVSGRVSLKTPLSRD